MADLSRRTFLASAAAAGTAALTVNNGQSAEPQATRRTGADIVTLGNSKVKTSILGIGTGTHGGRDQRMLGPNGFSEFLQHAFDRGIRYIDTADQYRMHGLVRNAIKNIPKDDLFIQTKTRAIDAQEAIADIERFRTELNIDRIGSLLMHCMTKRNFPTDMRPVMDVLHEAKEKGRVGAVGVSCHGLAPLTASVECDWCDVHLVRVNPFGDKMDGTPDQVTAQIAGLKKQERGVLGMKIYGESGFDSREKRLDSLKFVLGLGTVDAFTIGFRTTAQLDETMDLIEEATS